LNKVRDVFNVSSVAQAAAAAAISDVEHESRARKHNREWLAWLSTRVANLGLEVIPSAGNFVMARFGAQSRCQSAVASLRERGVLVMPLDGYGLPDALRITVGTAEANEVVVQAIHAAIESETRRDSGRSV
jgi:histidinol-phosphate aminotransferase